MTAGAGLMARPKKPDKPSDQRAIIVHLKGSVEYAAWLEAVHKKTHIPKATIIRLAVATWAKAEGHPEPPEF